MGVADIQPGDYVAHPAHGACCVVGVGAVTAAGETFDALALAPFAHPSALVHLPLSKLAGARLRVVTAAEAEAMPTPEADASWRASARARLYGARGAAAFKERRRLARASAFRG